MPLTKVRRGGTDTGIADASDATAITIDSSENVGIKTTSPTQAVEVAGNIFVNTSGNPFLEVKTSGAGNNPFVRLKADSNYWDLQTLFSNSNDELDFRYSGSSKAIITKDAKMGIGTSSPRMHLTVAGNNSTSVALGIDNASGGGTLDFACLGASYSAHGASAGEVWWYSPDNMNIGGATGNTNSIKFLGGGTERARINQYGQASFRNGIAFRPLAHYILTTSYQDICQIDTSSGDAGRGFILAVSSENNYHQHWNIQVSQNNINTYFFGGDSGHTHSKDVQWRKNNSHIQAKRSLSTGRALALYCAAGACIIDFDE